MRSWWNASLTWYRTFNGWQPGANQHAYSEHHHIQLDEDRISAASTPDRTLTSPVFRGAELSMAKRDSIFQLVSKTVSSYVSMPTFPSARCLDILIKTAIAKRLETDSWLHPLSFVSESTRPELLVALVAAGCVCFGVPSISRTGLVLLEVTRVSLSKWVAIACSRANSYKLTVCRWRMTTVPSEISNIIRRQ